MQQLKMKRWIGFLSLIYLLSGCSPKEEAIEQTENDTFLVLQRFIRENGTFEKVNISSMASKPVYTHYYNWKQDSIILTSEEATSTIYLSKDSSRFHIGLGRMYLDEKDSLNYENVSAFGLAFIQGVYVKAINR